VPDGNEPTRHPLKNAIAYRYNDFVNAVESKANADGTYDSPEGLRSPALNKLDPDFAINAEGDTVSEKFPHRFLERHSLQCPTDQK
jgi:hypothetical protein